jgi:predicted lysophospholipase L1 biosynthesis ABC-type transport system permease subunit
VQDLKNKQANKFNMTDYETLKAKPYVKKSQLTRQGIIPTSLQQPEDQMFGSFSSSSSEQNLDDYLSVSMLEDDALKTLLSTKKAKLQGNIPLKKNSCVVSRSLAKINKLKLGDTIMLGAKGQEHKIEIVGIAEFSTIEWASAPSSILISWETGLALEQNMVSNFSCVMYQLTDKKELKNFVKDFKKTKSFKNYSLINQSWSQEILKSFKDTLDLLFNGVVVALIIGLLVIAVCSTLAINQRQDFYTLHLMGMKPKLLSASSSLENSLLIIGLGVIAFFSSRQLSGWITGEWLIKLQKSLTEQEPFVDWTIPHLEQRLDCWTNYSVVLFLGVYLFMMLIITNLRIAKVVRAPLQVVAKP